jgi:hypothetical protein
MNELIKLSDDDYRKAEGISNSSLLLFDRSPLHLVAGKEPTEAMKLGTLIHSYLLENDFEKKYFVADVKDRRCKEYKAIKIEKEIVLQKDFEILKVIEKNLNEYELYDGLSYKQIAEKSMKEISIFWETDITGIPVLKKAKLDLLFQGNDYNLIIDLKKTENCLDFHWQIKRYKMYRQASWYIEGVTKLTGNPSIFVFLTLEADLPYGIIAYSLSGEYIFQGDTENLASTMKYMQWVEKGKPLVCYQQGIYTIEFLKYFGG